MNKIKLTILLSLLSSSSFAQENIYVQIHSGIVVNQSLPSPTTIISAGDIITSQKQFMYGAAIGYQFTQNMRMDISGNYLGNHKQYGDLSLTQSLQSTIQTADPYIKIMNVMLNAYYDFANIGEIIVPYVTLGAGMTNIDARLLAADSAGTSYIANPVISETKFAYQFGFGFTSKMSEHMTFDFGCKFTRTAETQAIARNLNSSLLMAALRYNF